MKFSAEKLFEIAKAEYTAAGFSWNDTLKEGVGEWASASADEDYANEDAVRAEVREYIAQKKEYEGVDHWYPLEETSGYGLDRADLIRKARQGGAEVEDDARIAVHIEDGAAGCVAIEDFCDWVFMTTVGVLYTPKDEEANVAAVEGCFK